MTDKKVDFFVIGGGSGGVRAARIAAQLGAKVAIAEDRYWGGTCVNVGCVPKKLFVYASHFRDEFEDAAGYGFGVGGTEFDWHTLLKNKNTEIDRLNGIYAKLLKDNGVETIEGFARLIDGHTVEVGGDTYHAEHILIATGGLPSIPEFPGREHVISSDHAFFLDGLPNKAVVVGGGYIAVEFAGIFHGLGVETTQLYRGELFLRGFDDDLREHLLAQMREDGVDLRMQAEVREITRGEDDQLHVTLKDGSKIATDLVMYATGRHPNTARLGLEAAGVECDAAGAVKVDDHFRTSVASVYAVGDVIDKINLTPVALAQGMQVAQRLFGGDPHPVDYEFVPTAVFSRPNIGTVGYTEAEALERFETVSVYRSSFRPMKHTMTGRNEKSLMKILVDAETDRVIGVHVLGPDAGEIVQGFAVALRAGATKRIFDTTIGIHPTAAEELVTMRTPVS